MTVYCLSHSFRYEIENLVRIFFPTDKITVSLAEPPQEEAEDFLLTRLLGVSENQTRLCAELSLGGKRTHREKLLSESEQPDTERELSLLAFGLLCEGTGYCPPWGILTGVRPSKLMRTHLERLGAQEAMRYFTKTLLVSPEKAALACRVAQTEEKILLEGREREASLYVSVPFCPTRCSYCSFVSHSIASPSAKKLIPEYIEKLCEDIRLTAARQKEAGLTLRSVYWGGGTPTTLTADQLDTLLTEIENSFPLSQVGEYTVEAGRPDTVDEEKLLVLKRHGVNRISINPQTFSDPVLRGIGRAHTVADTVEKYRLAREVGFQVINMDLIAGLPGDTLEGFRHSIDSATALSPENITVHTLARKRSSTLVSEEGGVAEDRILPARMLSYAAEKLTAAGYYPYYMYRQSRSLGNLENVGWCKKGTECYYNVVMMEESQSILSVGAGAVTKLCADDGSYIERVFSYKYPFEYNTRFSSLMQRKGRITSFFEEYK